MKTVAIITCIGKSNFGNRLQNYALHKVLTDYGFKVDTLKNTSLLNNVEDYKKNKKEYIHYRLTKKLKADWLNRRRIKYFNEFDKNIRFRWNMIDAINLPKTNYDYYCVGSDQIWNPFHGKLRDLDLLYCIEPQKRISYAASIGIDEIPTKFKKKTKKEMSKFKAISLREHKGKEIVEELTKRKDIEVVLDPTMLLTSQDWDKLCKRPKQLKTDKFILNYFLGELSPERKAEIERIAALNDCEIINILDKNGPFYETGPSEFLYLEKNAFLVCTDSFHSSVFAILYNRPFLIFDREDDQHSMNSRLETLLNTFKLTNQRFTGKITTKQLNPNYDKTNKILEEERLKSLQFIEKAFDVK